ncbi:MAG: regulatory iron-sulfur-containing complex subunit RicT [Pyramidobacter sp.]|nr:regulatory iron-sulfur-containing complex subunit RicT [Pyramidobacter sp.]
MYLTIFGKPRYLGLVVADDGTEFEKGEQLLIESSRGLEVAVVAGAITERQEALYRAIDNRQEGQPSSDAGLQNVAFVRRVEPEDLQNEEENRADEDKALVLARQILQNHDLDMKLVDVEYLNDRKKLFLYFTSEQRVDFRAYVRDLAREFRTRIELRQIGVRDESKVVKGLGTCGKPCCCSYWLQRFMPIGIRMVKEQNLALNPTKISGLCGRLMCCMNFEQENYRELWSSLPAHGSKIKTENGTWILLGVDVAARTCSLKGPVGFVNIPVSMYQKFKETVLAGEEWSNEANGLDEKGRSLVQENEEELPKELAGFVKRCTGCSGCGGDRALSDNISSACENLSRTFAEKMLPKSPRPASGSENAGQGEQQENGAPHRSRRRRKPARRDGVENASDASRPKQPQEREKKDASKPPQQKQRPAQHADGEKGAESGRQQPRRPRPDARPASASGNQAAQEQHRAPSKPNHERRRKARPAPQNGAGANKEQNSQKGTE